MKKVLTFIMAGGKGERLSPLTKDRAKPAVPFGGVYRIIDFTLSNCINSDLRRIHVLTQYKSYSLTRHISRGWNVLNSELGEYVDAIPAQQRVDEHWYQGTADSIYQNIYAIEDEDPEDVLILAGDHVYKMDYRKMIGFHRDQGADLTVAVVEIPREEAGEFGICELDNRCRVKNIIEKPETEKELTTDADNVFASMGIYVFKREALQKVLLENAGNKDSSHDFAKNIIPMMLNKYKIAAYNFKDEETNKPMYWRDVGSLDAYYEANMELVDVVPLFNLYDKNWPFRTYQEQFGPTKTVFAGGGQDNRIGTVLDSLVSHGCIISGGKVERSILSPNVRINSFSEVTESVLMEGVDIGRHAKIRRAIIDKYVKIPPDMAIGFNPEKDRKRFKVTESGIVVIPKNMVIT
ncbi:MAG: glucose-1-phosphate adenylyltransferase [Candidatus Omnitrophica bacterium]|nr:glucose-1-phosphate adenylyltransferase [Candidatus Omnitrophota bacterium]MBU4149963.1 glucose-1-phosphate adenylyltransferase [Candidatus Omnitrophota bacterium]